MQICSKQEFYKLVRNKSVFSNSIRKLIRKGVAPNSRLTQALHFLQLEQTTDLQLRQLTSIIRTKAFCYYGVLLVVLIFMIWQKNLLYSLNTILITLSLCIHCITTIIMNKRIQKIKLIGLKKIVRLVEETDLKLEQTIKTQLHVLNTQNTDRIFKLNQVVPVWEFMGVFLPIVLSIFGPVLNYVRSM